MNFVPMKRLPVLIALLALAASAAAFAAEAPNANEQAQEKVLALVKEVQGQQKTIAENQTKMDAKLATIAEAVRVARIYSSRGGR